MSSIYAIAHHTIIYLGDSSPQIDKLFTICESLLDHKQDIVDSSDSTVAQAFDQFVERPWFSRVWVLQELVLSRNPWVQCGTRRVPWKWLAVVIVDIFKDRQLKTCQSQRFLSMNHRRNLYQRNKFAGENDEATVTDDFGLAPPSQMEIWSEDFMMLLESQRGLGVTVPTDMVFANYGLLDARCHKFVEIDYDKSLPQVFEEVACQYLSVHCPGTSRIFRLLSLVTITDSESSNSELSSWVPDVRSMYSRFWSLTSQLLMSRNLVASSVQSRNWGTRQVSAFHKIFDMRSSCTWLVSDPIESILEDNRNSPIMCQGQRNQNCR